MEVCFAALLRFGAGDRGAIIHPPAPKIAFFKWFDQLQGSVMLVDVSVQATVNLLRPVPVPTAETRPFWDAAARGELSLPRCMACGRLHYPPLPRCPQCLSETLEWVIVWKKARVRSWTVAHLATVPGVKPPFTIVEGALQEQPDVIITALAADELAGVITLDQSVTIAFEMQHGSIALPAFILSEEMAAGCRPKMIGTAV